jgi:hypothetical protein
MEIRKLPIGQGLVWFKQSLDLGARNPRAVFGAALLLIAVLYGLALLLGLSAGVVARSTPGQPADLGRIMLLFVPMFLLLMLLFPVLIGGLMHVIREAEAGRPVRAFDLFAPFRQGKAPRLALLGIVQIVLALLGGLVVVAIAGADYWRDYLAAMQGAMGGTMPVVPQPGNPGLLMLVQLVFNYFSYAIMLLAVPLMLFSGSALVDAIKDSLRASVRNVGANVLAGGLFVLGVVVAAIVVALFAALIGVISNLVHSTVGSALMAVVFIGFGAVLLVVLTGGAYLAWRDTFGDAALPPPAVDGIEA